MILELKYKDKTYKLEIDEKILELYKEYHNPEYILEFSLAEDKILIYAKKI
jgi:hypothetical protein